MVDRIKTILFSLLALLLCISCRNEGDGLTVYYDIEIIGQVTRNAGTIPVENAQIIVFAQFPYNKITGGRDVVCDTFYTDRQGYYYPQFLQRVGNDYVISYWIDVTTCDTASVRWIKGDDIKYGSSLFLWVDDVTTEGYILPTANLEKNY